jgi:ferredoxin
MKTYKVELSIPDKGTANLEVGENEFILDAAYEAGYSAIPSMCLQGFCLTCASLLLTGEVDQSKAIRYYPQDKEAGFILICAAQPRSDLCIKTHQKKEMQNHRRKQGLPYPHG